MWVAKLVPLSNFFLQLDPSETKQDEKTAKFDSMCIIHGSNYSNYP